MGTNIDKFMDDELMELSPEDLGVDSTEEDEPLVADGDYGHEHTPTDESEDNDEEMEKPYEKQTAEKNTANDVGDDPQQESETAPETIATTEAEVSEPPVEPAEPTHDEADKKVPLSRLNKEISKRQALEERLQQLEAAMAKQKDEQIELKEVEVDPAAFTKMSEALLDGKSEDAMVLFGDMMKSVAQTAAHNAVTQSQQYANQVSQVSVAQSTQAELLQQTAYEMVQEYPMLDDSSTDFNAEILQTVIDLRDDFIASGRFHPHVALERAAKLVMMEQGVMPLSAQPVEPQTPPIPAAKKVDIAAKVEKANRQPAKVGGEPASGGEPKKLDINTMTDEEFEALSVDELRRLRGDYI